MARAMALGADVCYSARAMMLSIGCIQALKCNTNDCPVGVATQNKSLIKGLNVANKAQRNANYQEKTIHAFLEIVAASGLNHPKEIKRHHINKRVGGNQVKKYSELYPEIEAGCLLKKETTPDTYSHYNLEITSLA